jgi:hypothetical protein
MGILQFRLAVLFFSHHFSPFVHYFLPCILEANGFFCSLDEIPIPQLEPGIQNHGYEQCPTENRRSILIMVFDCLSHPDGLTPVEINSH